MTAESRRTRARGLLVAVVVVCVALAALTAPAAVAADDDSPPGIPAAYHGEIELNGEPVDPDDEIVVEAEVDGEVRGSVVVDEEGYYGSSDGSDERLVVDGDSSDEGATVTFYVDGDGIERTAVDNTSPETVTWESESTERVDITTDAEVDDAPAPGGPGPSPDPPDDDEDPQPTAAIDVDPDPATVGEEVTFDGSGSSVAEGDVVDFDWEIDGESYAGETVTESFDEAGTVDVELTVTTDAGETDTATDSLVVEAEDDDPDDPDEPEEDDDGLLPIPGFGAGAAIVAILGAALLATRLRN